MRTTEATVAATMIRRKVILAAVTSTKKRKNTLAAATKARRKVIPTAVMSIKKKKNILDAATKTRRKVIPAAVMSTKKMNITANKTTIKTEPALSFHDKAGLSFISVAFNYCFLN